MTIDKVIIYAAPGHGAVACSADLLAGCAGFNDTESFVAAIGRDEAVLKDAVASLDQFVYREIEHGDSTVRGLRERLVRAGYSVVDTPADTRRHARTEEFIKQVRAGQGAVVLQASRHPSLREKMTTAALVLATVVATSMIAARPVKAADFPPPGQPIQGGGILTVLAAAKSAQSRFNLPGPQAMPSKLDTFIPALATYGLPNGSKQLDHEQHAKLAQLEHGFLQSRDALAQVIAADRKIQENAVLSPHDPAAQSKAGESQRAMLSLKAKYMDSRNEFCTAAFYMASHEYNVNDFAFSYKVAFNDVTQADMSPRVLADFIQKQQPRPQPGSTVQPH